MPPAARGAAPRGEMPEHRPPLRPGSRNVVEPRGTASTTIGALAAAARQLEGLGAGYSGVLHKRGLHRIGTWQSDRAVDEQHPRGA
jgi:hypothetical protein